MVIKVKTLSNYIDEIDHIKKRSEDSGNKAELLFRGQRKNYKLLPKLARLDLNGDILNIEKLMMDEFRRASLPLLEFQPENNWDLLALAQHHGLPTRLLDWSYSALVALWFAVQKEPLEVENKAGEKVKKNGVIWVLNAEVEDFRDTDKQADPLLNKKTMIFRSRVVSKRISAQAGAFTVHKVNESNKVIKLDTNKRFKNKLTKIEIPPECFSVLRKSLMVMGVNHSTVFPDIDGLCQHLERRFSKLKDEI